MFRNWGLIRKLLFQLTALASVVFIALFYENCGMVERPGVSNLSSYSYKHTGFEKSCSDCHHNAVPAETFKVVSLNIDTLNTAFYHSAEFGGTADCITCHKVDNTKPTLSWSDGKYNHLNGEGLPLQSCATCHDDNRPLVDKGIPAFSHTTNGKGDCLACHGQTVANQIFDTMDNWKGGEYFPSGLIGTGTLQTNVGVITFSNATITNVTQTPVTLPLLMNHYSTQVSASAANSCINCHTGAPTGNYSGGAFHRNVTPQPASCLECHEQTLPTVANGKPRGFMGPISAKRNPRSGEMRHIAHVWEKDGNGLMQQTQTLMVDQECSTCHKNPGSNWSSAFYHSELQNAGKPQPASCIACHANSPPVGPTGTHMFDHADLKYGVATNDCNTCHLDRITNGVVTADWKGGTFPHDPRPVTCVLCHANDRPTTLVGTPPFDHTLNGKGDCVGCHGATNTYTSIADWAGGEAMPTDLIGSKNITVTVGTPTFTNTTISKVTTSTQTLPLQMDHYSPEFPALDAASCVKCHTGAATGNFSGGAFHKNITTLPTKCSGCHINAKPMGFVGPAGLGRTPPSSEMRHEAVEWMTNTAGILQPTTNKIIDGLDCSTCHTGTGVTFSKTKFHTSLAAAGVPQPSSCIDCHANTRPIGTVGNPLFNHQNNGGLTDCITCHKPTAFTSLANWAGGQFAHTGVTSCNSCHSAERPINNLGWVTPGWTTATTTFNFSTHGGTTDCVTCHTNVNTYVSPANWAVGNYTHTAGLTACATCHKAPTGLVGRPTPSFDHVNAGTNDCIGCHSGTPTSYTQLSGWPLGAQVPTGLVNDDITKVPTAYWLVNPTTLNYTGTKVTSTTKTTNVKLPMQILHSSNQITNVNTCTTCHSTLPAVANTGTKYHPHGSPTSCTSCHLTNGTPKGIVGPLATTVDKVANMDHNFKYGAGAGTTAVTAAQECNVCHTTGTGSSWATGVFHSKVGTNVVASCTACHYVKMPQVLDAVNTLYTTIKAANIPMHFSHTSTAVTSQECTTCHKQVGPATGNATPWATNAFFHKNITTQPTQCLSCHATDKPVNGLTQSNFDHATIGTNDCNSCHTVTAATTLWRPATSYNHTQPFQNCKGCHETKQPFPRPGPTVSTRFNILTYTPARPLSATNDRYFHDTKYNGGTGTDCLRCHANTTAFATPGLVAGLAAKVGTSWQNGYYDHTTNGTTRVGNSTCINCHDTGGNTFYSHNGVRVNKGSTAPCLTCH